MCLYSYYIKIPKYNIEIERDIPDHFLKKYNLGGKSWKD